MTAVSATLEHTHGVVLIDLLDTKLADRTSSFQSALTTETDKTHKEPALSPGPKDSKTGRDVGTPSVLDSADAIAKVRQDLAEAQRSRSLMAAKLHSVTEELKELKIQSSLNNQRIDELVKEKGALVTGMRDRDEELRGKAKLLEVSKSSHQLKNYNLD